MPDKIKNHARSQPIKLAGKSTIAAEKKIDESRLDEEINSIVKKGISRGTRSQPLRRQFKLTTLPRKDVMAELREKLAQRQRIIEDSTKEVTVEQMIVPKEDKRQKLTSQVLKETEKYVETIPRLVSTDTATTRSRPMQASDRCGATCGTLLCFGDSDVSKPLRLKWKRGDFLTVNEALLVLDDSDDWDGASTMASMKGPSFSVEELSAALASRKSLPKDSPVNTESGPIAKQQSACPTGPDHSKSSSDIGVAIFNASSPNAQDRKHYSVSKEDDGGASLAYSNATEDGGEPKILKSSSDDSSMVPLRHGERERSNNSIPRIHVDETVVDDSPGHNMIRASSDELVIALSLSQDSNDSIPIPQRMKSQQGIFVALDDATTQELTDGNTSIWHSSGNMASRSNDEHQEELLAKIQEFQHRKQAQSLTGNDDSNESSTPLVNESATARNIHRRPIRAEVDLPRASKKIAQAYIDALSKKFEGNTIALMKPRIPSSGTPPSDTMVLTTDRSDEMIPAAPTKSKKGNERTKKVVQKPSDPKPEILGLDVRPAPTLADHKSYESRSTARESNGEVYDLVERIDNVVQRLIEVGKIDPSGSSFEGSELEQRTTRSNTQELLQNLAILRARRSSGASSKHDPALSVSSSLVPGVGSSSVPKSLTIPTTTTVSATYKPRPSPRVETKSLQDLRARRDQAAMAVRMSAQRLSGLSKDYSENTNILQETPTPHPPAFQGRSFSSVKLNGPPRPESFSAWVPSRILSATPRKPEKDSFSTIETKSIIERVAVEDRRGSLHFPISLPDALSSDLGDWEQEQLQELPVLLQTTFSGTHAPVGLMDDDYWDKEPDNALEGSDEETENSFSDDDETTDYGSDDDSERLLRIESMIHELRAKRLLRF